MSSVYRFLLCSSNRQYTSYVSASSLCRDDIKTTRERERDGSGKLINRLVGDADRTGASLAACLFRVASWERWGGPTFLTTQSTLVQLIMNFHQGIQTKLSFSHSLVTSGGMIIVSCIPGGDTRPLLLVVLSLDRNTQHSIWIDKWTSRADS